MSKLTIVRGLPGSGKSTYARTRLDDNTFLVEADQFFMKNGHYMFDSKLLSYAHSWCLASVVKDLHAGYNVVVANTFTQLWELNKYTALVQVFPDLEVEIVEIKTQFGSVHNVPQETLNKMAARWEDVSDACIARGMKITRIV